MNQDNAPRLPHPLTGQPFPSPVPPGSGWPEDPAPADAPVAHDAAAVRELAATADDVDQLNGMASVCRACERLVQWREDVATTKRASFAGEPYWGRPVPSYGDPRARIAIIGLAPAANGGNRTGRMFTGDRAGDWIYAALHRAGFAEHETVSTAGDGQALHGVRMVAPVRCAPPANKPTPTRRPRAVAGSTARSPCSPSSAASWPLAASRGRRCSPRPCGWAGRCPGRAPSSGTASSCPCAPRTAGTCGSWAATT